MLRLVPTNRTAAAAIGSPRSFGSKTAAFHTRGKLRAGFDAHVAVVSQASGFEAVRRAQMQYLELVIDQEVQVLPLAILWVRPPL